jgi:KUP system potassium uptake protein
VVAVVVFACLITWGRGTALVRSRVRARSQPLAALEDYSALEKLPITAVYFTWDGEPLEYLPLAFTEHAHMMKALGKRSVILQIVRSDEARLDDDERLSARSITTGVDLLVARFGFRESASLPVIAREARDLGIDIDGDDVLFVFTRVYPVVGHGGSMPVLQQRLYTAMQRASEESAQWIRVPLEQVLSVGAVILLGDSELEESQ